MCRKAWNDDGQNGELGQTTKMIYIVTIDYNYFIRKVIDIIT